MGAATRMNAKGLVAALVLFAALTTTVVTAQVVEPCDLGSNGNYSGTYPKVSQQPAYEIAPQEFVELASDFDGSRIQMVILRPVVPEGVKVPVIATAGP